MAKNITLASTDGNNIVFNRAAMASLSRDEIRFVIGHELLHHRLLNPEASLPTDDAFIDAIMAEHFSDHSDPDYPHYLSGGAYVPRKG